MELTNQVPATWFAGDSRDPPPGVARATAPPTRGRRRIFRLGSARSPDQANDLRLGQLQGSAQRALCAEQGPLALVQGADEIVAIGVEVLGHQPRDALAVSDDDLDGGSELGGRGGGHRADGSHAR